MKLLRSVAKESSLFTPALSRRRSCGGGGGVWHFCDAGDGGRYKMESLLWLVDLVLAVSLLDLGEPELLYEDGGGK